MPARPDGGRPAIWYVESERSKLRFQISAKAHSHSDVAYRIFQDQVPANDPCDQFTQRRVRIRVSASGNRNHRGQFRIAQSCKTTGDRHQKKRHRNCRSSGWASVQKHAGKIPVLKKVLEDVQHLSMQQRRRRVLSCRRSAGKHKDSRADNRADTKGRQRPRSQRFWQTVARPFRVRNQLVNGLLGEELAGQKGLLKERRLKWWSREKQRCGAETHQVRLYAVTRYSALGRAAGHLLHLGLFGAARIFAGLLGRLLFARRAL